MDEKNLEELNEEILNELNEMEKMPMYAMTLANKELFHSNFWKWIFEYENEKESHEFLKFFFDKIEYNNDICITREKGHRDITIWCGNDAYVIENKLKSSADIEQLKRYKSDIEKSSKNFVGGVLTGVSCELDENELKNIGWTFKSYSDISTKLADYYIKTDNERFEDKLIRKYAEMIDKLSSVIEDFYEINEKEFFFDIEDNKELQRQIDEMKLRDVWQKRRAGALKKHLIKSTNINGQIIKTGNGTYQGKIQTGYTNGYALVDIFYISEIEESDDKEAIKKIGVQIQGKQFRYYIEGFIKGEQGRLFNKYKGNAWFENYDSSVKKTIHEKKTGQKNKYCQFNPDFVYQYWTITKHEAKFEKLTRYIVKAMSRAEDILQK